MTQSSYRKNLSDFLLWVKKDWAFVLTLALSIIAFYFTTRFEKLSAKSAVSPYNDLSFEIQISVLQTNSFLDSWLSATYNWILTNLQGMFFGLWLASLFQTYIASHRQHGLFFNRSIFAGALGSTVLGLCVNCAIPIAVVTTKKNKVPDFVKGLLLGSHGFNFIIIGLMFSILPFELAIIKIFALLLLMFLIKEGNDSVNDSEFQQHPNQSFSLFQVVKTFCLITLKYFPYLILGGLIGNLVYITIPNDFLLNYKPNVLSLFFLSIFFSLLPVPLTFDIIFSSHLLKMGVSTSVALVPLLTLGTSSILVIFFLRRSLAIKKILIFHFLTIMVGFVVSATALLIEKTTRTSDLKALGDLLSKPTSVATAKPTSTKPARPETPTPCHRTSSISRSSEISIEKTSFCLHPKKPSHSFSKVSGQSIGLLSIAHDFYSSELSIHNKFFLMPSFLSSGDWNGDGFDDLLITTSKATRLFLNNKSSSFVETDWPSRLLSHNISFFIDVDNDGDQDAVSFDFGGQHFEIILNHGGSKKELLEIQFPLTMPERSFVNAVAIKDINNDGYLDLFVGMYSLKVNDLHSTKRSQNFFLRGPLLTPRGQLFEQDSPGETMTALFEDVNGDKIDDLIVGNDYNVPDYVFPGSQAGITTIPLSRASSIPISSKNTMSITAADFNNDGKSDLFFADMGPYDKKSTARFCHEAGDVELVQKCEATVTEYLSANNNFKKCKTLGSSRKNCLLNATIAKSKQYHSVEFCDLLTLELSSYKEMCKRDVESKIPFETNFFPTSNETKQVSRNVLLVSSDKGYLETNDAVIANSYWSWNALANDFDNDGDIDLYIVNGDTIFTPKTPNVFYENQNNGKFVEIAAQNNSNLYADSRSSLAIDVNLDGSLDVLLGSTLMAPTLLQGQGPNESIRIKLVDLKGEKSCVGCSIRATIGNQLQSHKIRMGGGHRSLGPCTITIGLDKSTQVDNLEVTWGDGQKTNHPALPSGNTYKIIRGSAKPQKKNLDKPL